MVESIVWSGGGVDDARVGYQYDGRGLVTDVLRYSDVGGVDLVGQTTNILDVLGRRTGITHQNSAGATVADYQFNFDLASQITQQTINGEVSNYTLDELGQLVASDNTDRANESFTYDENGNRIDGDNVIGPNNQLLSDGQFQYDYDAEGNLIQKTEIANGEITEYTFDHRNRITHSVRRSSGGIILSESSFTFDVFDRMIAHTSDSDGEGPQSSTTRYTVYDGANAWADFNEAGEAIARYLFGEGLDQNIARWRPGEGTAWYLADHLGSIRDVVDATGALINHTEYDSFGNILLETNPAAGDRFKFTGREWFEELGMYYYRARFYDPVTGRFASQDPIGFNGRDANLYRYVGNQPNFATDPTGNTAAPGYLASLEFSKLGIATATGFAGFVVGHACGVLDAFFSHDPKTDGEFNFEAASAGIIKQAVLGGVIGAGVGVAASICPTCAAAAAPLFSSIFTTLGTALALVDIATAPNVPAGVVRAACFIAEAGAGAIIGRKFKRCFVEGTPVIIEQFDVMENEASNLSRSQMLLISGAVCIAVFAALAANERNLKKKRCTCGKKKAKGGDKNPSAESWGNLIYLPMGSQRLEAIS